MLGRGQNQPLPRSLVKVNVVPFPPCLTVLQVVRRQPAAADVSVPPPRAGDLTQTSAFAGTRPRAGGIWAKMSAKTGRSRHETQIALPKCARATGLPTLAPLARLLFGPSPRFLPRGPPPELGQIAASPMCRRSNSPRN